MKNIYILSHGKLAEGLAHMAGMVLGEVPNLSIIEFSDGMGAIEFNKYFQTIMLKTKATESSNIFLCDLQGGTPFKEAMSFIIKNNLQNSVLVYGVNFPMLLLAYECFENNESIEAFKDNFNNLWGEHIGIAKTNFVPTVTNNDDF